MKIDDLAFPSIENPGTGKTAGLLTVATCKLMASGVDMDKAVLLSQQVFQAQYLYLCEQKWLPSPESVDGQREN